MKTFRSSYLKKDEESFDFEEKIGLEEVGEINELVISKATKTLVFSEGNNSEKSIATYAVERGARERVRNRFPK